MIRMNEISSKVLTASLRSMEEDGIVTRTVYAEVPPRVEYALSELGESMRPVLDAMREWETPTKGLCKPLSSYPPRHSSAMPQIGMKNAVFHTSYTLRETQEKTAQSFNDTSRITVSELAGA